MVINSEIIDGVEIPVGMDENFFGAEDYEIPEMLDPNPNGIVMFKDVELVKFGTMSQAMASLYFARFSIDQIKKLLPAISELENVVVTKMINDTCSREVRQDFIKSLHGNMPRQLTKIEMVNVVKAVGFPEGRPKKINLQKTLAAIEFDMKHVELIKQEPINPRRPLTAEQIKEKIDRLHRSLTRKETRMSTITRKLAAIENTLSLDPENERATYNKVKLSNAMEDLKAAVADSLVKLESLENELTQKQ